MDILSDVSTFLLQSRSHQVNMHVSVRHLYLSASSCFLPLFMMLPRPAILSAVADEHDERLAER